MSKHIISESIGVYHFTLDTSVLIMESSSGAKAPMRKSYSTKDTFFRSLYNKKVIEGMFSLSTDCMVIETVVRNSSG